MEKLGVGRNNLKGANLAENLPLFPIPQGSEEYLGDTRLLGKTRKNVIIVLSFTDLQQCTQNCLYNIINTVNYCLQLYIIVCSGCI